MGISGLDLNFVRTAVKLRPKIFARNKASLPSADRLVNENGETVVSKIQQEQKRLDDTEVDLIIAAYEGGKSTYELAKQFGCHRKTITYALKNNGIDVTTRKDGKLNIEDIISMYEEMHTTAEIAKTHGVSPNIISRLLHSHGVEMRGRWDYSQKIQEQ